MSKPICKLFLLGVLLFSALTINAQNESRYKEAIIGYPSISTKQAVDIEQIISGTSGLHFVNFCTYQQCILVTYDPDVYADPQAVASFLQTQYPGYIPMVKTGATHEQVAKDCK